MSQHNFRIRQIRLAITQPVSKVEEFFFLPSFRNFVRVIRVIIVSSCAFSNILHTRKSCVARRFVDCIFNIAFNAAGEKFAFTFFPGLARFDLANFSARPLARIIVHAKSVLVSRQKRWKSTGGRSEDGAREFRKRMTPHEMIARRFRCPSSGF